jgi:hypothetical protein
MWDTNLGDQEWLTRVTDAANKLSERFVVWLLLFFDEKLRGEEAGLVPIVHLQTREGTLCVAGRIAVDPSHTIRHDHSALLRLGRLA